MNNERLFLAKHGIFAAHYVTMSFLQHINREREKLRRMNDGKERERERGQHLKELAKK